jgi:hypothetical protein
MVKLQRVVIGKHLENVGYVLVVWVLNDAGGVASGPVNGAS